MNFIEDDGFACQAKETEEEVARVEDSEQCLIDRADPIGSQQTTLARHEPLDSASLSFRLVLFSFIECS